MKRRGPWRAFGLGIAGPLVLLCPLVLGGCGGGGVTVTSTPGATGPDSSGVRSGSSATTVVAGGAASGGAAALSREEVLRRLALPRFAYVGEEFVDKKGAGRVGQVAFIDAKTDKPIAVPSIGKHPGYVAMAPDGGRVYVTDQDIPILHELDSETHKETRALPLPGVEPRPELGRLTPESKVTYDQLAPCGSVVACTPDGRSVVLGTKAGLMVMELESGRVVRTYPEIQASALAISFDGKRAYVGTSDLNKRGAMTMLEFVELSLSGKGGGLLAIDLGTGDIVKRRETGVLYGLAMKPDGSELYGSDGAARSLRIMDPQTLEDIKLVPLMEQDSHSQPRGVGVLPNGSKVYVVCASSGGGTPQSSPSAGDFFCAVVDTADRQVIKSIPLQAY